MLTVFDSDELPANDRVEAWAETTGKALVTTRLRYLEPDRFAASLHALPLGAAQLSSVTSTSLLSQRTPRLIRQSDPEHYLLAVITSGRQRLEQARRTAVLGAGTMVFFDSSRPFEGLVHRTSGRAGCLLLQFPRKLLCLPERDAARLLAAPLSAREGVGHLLARFLMAVPAEHSACSVDDLGRLGNTAVDLVGAVLARHTGAAPGLASESGRHVLTMRVQSFIHRHLADPDLTPAAVAAAHHLSLRSLHRLFEHQGTTVAAFIRRHRLERARHDLADPRLAARPIHAVAAHCGFTRADNFTRAFRTAYGMSPSAHRHAALRDRTGNAAMTGGRRVPADGDSAGCSGCPAGLIGVQCQSVGAERQ